jgi:carbon-monoxide dehydrogenase medium subunit
VLGRTFAHRQTMKPAAFRYFAPRTIDEAVDLLAEHGDEGRVLAGGQSLVPAMNFRLARPASLIDINRIATLDYVREQDGALCIGALARHARFEMPVAPGALTGFLPLVARQIAHLPIRVRGTFAGSIAHADPGTPFCLSSGDLGLIDRLVAPHDEGEDLAGDVALQGPNGFKFRMPFGNAFGHVDLGFWIGA